MKIKCESCKSEQSPLLVPHLRDLDVVGKSLLIGNGIIDVICGHCERIYNLPSFEFHSTIEHVCSDLKIIVHDHAEFIQQNDDGAEMVMKFKCHCQGCASDFEAEVRFDLTTAELID